MNDITWTFTIVVKTDYDSGQPSMKQMEELLGHMNAQLEHLSDEMGYEYKVEKLQLKSDE